MKVKVQEVRVTSGTGTEQSSPADGFLTDLTGREIIRLVREDGAVEGYYNQTMDQLTGLSPNPPPCELLRELGECESGDLDCLQEVIKRAY